MPIENLRPQSGHFNLQFEEHISPGSYNQTGASQQARVGPHTDEHPQSTTSRPESCSAFQSAARRIANAISATRTRLNSLFSLGHQTAGRGSAQRSSSCNPFAKLSCFPKLKSDHQNKINPPGSQTERLRTRMFKNGSLSQKGQQQLLSEIKRQSQALGATKDNPMFTYRDDIQPKPSLSGEPIPVTLVKPGHTAKLVLADLYEKKYGIKIHVQNKDLIDPAEISRLLLEKINAANGEPVGFVLHEPIRASNADSPTDPDYLGHVMPFIMQKTPKGFDMIDLNVGESLFAGLYRAAYNLNKSGQEIRHLVLERPVRQADTFSCHTDAMQVLKDALVAHKKVGGNLGEHYKNNYLKNPAITAWEPGKFEYGLELPTELHKVVQNSKAMASTKLSADQVLATTTPSANPNKKQTVGQHRERFSTTAHRGGNPVNNFLMFKAYKNALKVLDQLNSFPDAQSRNQYLQTIQQKNGFE